MRKIVITALLTLVMVTTGCGNGAKKELNKMLVELADKDQTIDTNDWKQIADYLDRNKAHFKDFYQDGQMDEGKVEEYISDFFEHRRPPKEIRFVGIGGKELSFNIYVERSGSMAPYDSPNGDGSFRSAIMSLQNNLPGKSKVDSIGEKGYTDFRQIFDNILNKTGDDQVSILVTDMIYSVKDMEGVNPQKVFAEAQEMINAVFKEEVKKKSMLVVRMNGSYNGPYYAYDNSVHPFSGRRPYYIIIVGSNDNIVRLTSDASLRTFAEMERLRGYDNMCLFTADDIYNPYYSLLLSNKDVRGRFQPEHGQGYQITSLQNVEADRNSGDIQLVLAVDLSKMFIDHRYLTDKANYVVSSDDNVKIKEIRPLDKADMTPAQKKYLGTATHLFVLSATNVSHEQDVTIRLLNRLPAWVESGSTDNDLQPDSRTTFALRYLLGGIFESYKRNAESEPAYFEMDLKLDK
ncbi:MAG: hypothetical protein I3J02_12245 [Prevotella sp.]|nr:hypothetical protein [Prevotella sp.]